MQDPLKQGLKLVMGLPLAGPAPYSNARSTKTRIETLFGSRLPALVLDSNARSTKTRIETSILKTSKRIYEIRMQDPLKQGLKRCFCQDICCSCSNSNARSTKTRIETRACWLQRIWNGDNSNARSTKTRIETCDVSGGFVIL